LKLNESNTLPEGFFTFFKQTPVPAENAPFPQEALETAVAQLKASMPAEEFRQKCFYFRMIAGLLPSTETAIPKPPEVSEKRILKINAYIEANYMKNIRLSDIAKHVGLSKEFMCGLYKKHTARTIISYQNEIRIEASARMLRKTDDLISGIAYSCGFDSVCYFNKTFLQLKGMTPGQFKKKIKI
jgi:transcriptional regulator GlxA family with amidase domain